jgi:hypothetical protein
MVVLVHRLSGPQAVDALSATAGTRAERSQLRQNGSLRHRCNLACRASMSAAWLESPKDIPETHGPGQCRRLAWPPTWQPWGGTRAVEEVTCRPNATSAVKLRGVGVFVCDCGENIGGVIDVGTVVDYAATLPDVACWRMVRPRVQPGSMERIEEAIGKEQASTGW